MPMWLADLIPVLFDDLAPERVYPQAKRFGEAVARWHVLSEAQWDVISTRFRVWNTTGAVVVDDAIARIASFLPPVVTARLASGAAGDAAAKAVADAAGILSPAAVKAAAATASMAISDQLFTYLLDLIEGELAVKST